MSIFTRAFQGVKRFVEKVKAMATNAGEMYAKTNTLLVHKTIYRIILLALFYSTFGVGNLSFARAQDEMHEIYSPGSRAGLFSEISPGISTITLEAKPFVVRSRLVNIDFSQLSKTGQIPKSQYDAAETLTLNLFDDISMIAELNRLEINSSGSVSWIGHIQGQPHNQVILVAKNNQMQGVIITSQAVYQVRYAGYYHAIEQLDQSKYPNESAPTKISNLSVPMVDQTIMPQTAEGSIIDVMVVYTTDAKNAAGGDTAISNLIDLAMNETNLSYVNSGITQEVNLVHKVEVNYAESGNLQTDRDRLQNQSDGYIDNIHELRDTYLADLVVMIVENNGGGNSCGISYVMESVSTSFADHGFAVVVRDCATGNYSFGHEMGHTMSARHDWFQDASNNSGITALKRGLKSTTFEPVARYVWSAARAV